jgi:hypothetical protein
MKAVETLKELLALLVAKWTAESRMCPTIPTLTPADLARLMILRERVEGIVAAEAPPPSPPLPAWMKAILARCPRKTAEPEVVEPVVNLVTNEIAKLLDQERAAEAPMLRPADLPSLEVLVEKLDVPGPARVTHDFSEVPLDDLRRIAAYGRALRGERSKPFVMPAGMVMKRNAMRLAVAAGDTAANWEGYVPGGASEED